MATTPKFSLPLPADSTYVADTALIIRDANSIIDTVLDVQETRVVNAEQAAKDAAGLVNAPAGSAVLAAISEGGAARSELTAAIDDSITNPSPEVSVALEKTPASPKRGASRAMVAFVFDDFPYPSVDHSYTLPMLTSKGIKATFAPFINGVASAEYRWQELRDVAAAGHEIANHSETHPTLSGVSDAVLETEIIEAHNKFVARGVTPTGFVWPNNASDSAARGKARDLYRYAMAGGSGINTTPLKSYNLSRAPLGNSTTLESIKAQIDAAKVGKYLLAYVVHSANLTTVGRATLEASIDYAIAQGVAPVTVSEALDVVGNVYDAGDFSVGGTYTVIDKDGMLHSGQSGITQNSRFTFGGGTEQVILIPIPDMGQFKTTVFDLTIIAHRYYSNAVISCEYAAKVFVGVGAGDSALTSRHPYLPPVGFAVAPVTTVVRDTVTNVTSIRLTFTQSDPDGQGSIVATIAR